MDDISIFPDKAIEPTQEDVRDKLGTSYELWMKIHDFVLERYPKGIQEWNYPGKKYGWSYRIKDKKRVIIYFLPRDGFFMVGFVFGQKAYDQVITSNVSADIKSDLQQARKYAEGRGVRILVKNDEVVEDIKTLVEIKMAN